MDDDEFTDVEFDIDPGDEFIAEHETAEPFMTARQRIEIAREERLLRSMLSDFDDWDYDGINTFENFENSGSDYADQFSL